MPDIASTFTPPKLRVLVPAEKIKERIEELGKQISADYQGPIIMIGILKGAFIFMSDLARVIENPTRIDFMGISSYGNSKSTSGEVRLTKDLDMSVEGLDVLVVEDIVDSGVTLTYLIHLLSQRRPRSIRIAALLDKPDRRMRPIKVNYCGFEIPDEFVVGFGLDYAEEHRNLKDICVLEG
ncbi:hypoxanthine phosphoribosyltransferase [Bryobacter aggregatus]|uniref:hypoxanthine phosphoribosyltransferase n=1 Tax=Bryobacter aggregatus TaxID=360054 RepID=UPI000691BF60|nr:hypoxanthine phosphoribosyltransferase [Bryobacter aggregatus]